MTKTEIFDLLEKNKNEKYIQRHKEQSLGMNTFGLGMTACRKIAKQCGRNHTLAMELWKEPYIETKLIASMIADPKEISDSEIEEMFLNTHYWLLSHSLANNLVSKYKGINRLFEKWYDSKNDSLQRAAYLLLYEIAKKEKNPEIEKYKSYIDSIRKNIQKADNFTKDAMNDALIALGSNSKELNDYAIKAAEEIGIVEVDYGDNSCQALNAAMHLKSKRIQDKLH
jgi:3-methyladenine DNA glycosylase AlkD